MRIVILGPPGSGKGTQAALIASRFGIPHIMPSELLHGDRQSATVSHDNPLHDYATKRLRRKDASGGFLVDGFPRTIQQALALDEVLGQLKRPLHLALRIVIDADAMIQRLAGRRRCRDCGRQFNIFVTPTRLEEQCDACGGSLHWRVDDTEEVIDNRLRVYESLSLPVVAFYRANGLLRDIPGDAPVESVNETILAAIKQVPGLAAATKAPGPKRANGAAKAAGTARNSPATRRVAAKKAATGAAPARDRAGKREAPREG